MSLGAAAFLRQANQEGEEYLAGVGCTRNIETCDVAAAMWTDVWLLRNTGSRDFADRLERVFFNAGPAPIARDFQTMSYYQCANRLSMSLPAQEPRAPRPGCYRFCPLGNEVLCCVGNCNRIIPSYITHMWMATPDGGLAQSLAGPCRLRTFVAGGAAVAIDCRTAYPFDEMLHLTVRPATPVAFPLYLRVPQWCRRPEIKVSGQTIAAEPDPKGFVCLRRTWTAGDTIAMRWPMEASVRCGRETPYPAIPYFTDKRSRELGKLMDIHNPYASVTYGPLLFALPIADVDPNQPAAGAKWNYALNLAPSQAQAVIRAVRAPMPGRWQWPLDAPLKLTAPAMSFAWSPTELQPLPAEPVAGGASAQITLVPYGCTKFRVSMFPVTPLTWQAKP